MEKGDELSQDKTSIDDNLLTVKVHALYQYYLVQYHYGIEKLKIRIQKNINR